MQKSNHCLFAPRCHLRSGKDLIWMWRDKGPLVLIGVWTVLEFLSLVSVRSFVICPCPFSEQGVLNCDGWACLLASESSVDCGNWPENLMGAKGVAWKLFSSGIDTYECWPVLSTGAGAQPQSFGIRFVMQCPSSPEWQRWLVRTCWSEQAFQEIPENGLLPKGQVV